MRSPNRNIVCCLFLLVLTFAGVTAGQAKLPSSPIKTIYVVPSSHYDFGFVEPPSKVRERAARHIDEVIKMSEQNQDFRWTIESVWQVNEWLKRQKRPESVLPKDTEKIARLMSLLRSGRIELSTAWGSMHTDFLGSEELNRQLYDYAALASTYGINSELAYMNDVPGHPSTVASMLADSGTRYLVTGANTFLSKATDLAPGKVPFYWQAPDGNKVLLWISQSNRGAYVEGLSLYYLDPYTLDPYTGRTSFDMFNPELAETKTDLEVMEIGITDLLNEYNTAGYKYDAVMVMYAHDFLEPSSVLNLDKAAKMWNARHPEVQIRIATPTEFLKYIEHKYADQLPTYRGDWSGLWSESKTASPRISGDARFAQDHTPVAETLWSALSMTRGLATPSGSISAIFDDLFVYDEHSGAGNTGWPQLNSTEPLNEQNREYVEITGRARQDTERLLDRGISIFAQPTRFETPRTAAAESFPLVVYNGLSWMRSDVVTVESPAAGRRIAGIKNAVTGANVPFDIDASGAAVFVAKDVPAMGYATFEIATAAGRSVSTLKPLAGNAAETADVKVEMNADGTVKSIFDKKRRRELVNAVGSRPFNDLLRVEGSDASQVVYPVPPRISVRKGVGMAEISVVRERSIFPETTITMIDGVDGVRITNRLDETKMPFVGGNKNWHDSYYFAFPANVSADGLKVMRGGQRWFDTFPDDYLSGARKDSVSTRHSIGLADGRSSVLIAHRQAFHWVYAGYVSTKVRPQGSPAEFPAMYTGKWPLPEATLFSRAVRYGTQADTHDRGTVNIATVEPGLRKTPMVFEYSISGADGPFDAVRSWRAGAEFNVPLRAVYTAVAPAESSKAFFGVDQPNVQIVTVKAAAADPVRGEVSASPLNPTVNKVFVIRLQEFAGKPTTVKVNIPAKIKAASRTSLTENFTIERIINVSPLTLHLRPFQTATVKFEIE